MSSRNPLPGLVSMARTPDTPHIHAATVRADGGAVRDGFMTRWYLAALMIKTMTLGDARPTISTSVYQTVIVCVAVVYAAACAILNAPPAFVPIGIVVILFPAFLIHWDRWRKRGSKFGGALLIYPAAFILCFTLGSLKLGERGALGVDPDDTQWWLYGVGLVAFMLGACITSGKSPRFGPAKLEPAPAATGRFMALAGLGLAAVNYATGGIPVLSANVNALRFRENSAILGPATGFIVGMEMFALVVLLLERWSRGRRGERQSGFDALLILALLASLFASGSRTFLVLPLIAYALARLEAHVVKALTVLLVVVVGFSALTGYNYVRQQQSGTAEALDAALVENGLADYPLASGILSLQIGPRVFQVSRDKIPDSLDFQHGQFFLADASVILRTGQKPSDFFTTTYVTNRSYAQVGGSPPTVLGGLYIDGGVPLLIVGMMFLGFATRRFRDMYLISPNLYTAAAYGFWGAWMLHSIYNYVSLKPMVLTFLALCLFGSTRTKAKAREEERAAAMEQRPSRYLIPR